MTDGKKKRQAPPCVYAAVVFFSEDDRYLATEYAGIPADIKTEDGAAAWLKASKRWRHGGEHMFVTVPGIGPVFVPAGQK